MKYLGINLTNRVQDLYAENYKMLIKKIKEDINNGLGSPNIVNTSVLPKSIYRFNTIPISNPSKVFLVGIGQLNLKLLPVCLKD